MRPLLFPTSCVVVFFCALSFSLPDLPDTKPIEATTPQGSKSKPEGGVSNVGKELERFGEEVAQRVDKIVSKRGFELWGDPWTIQGIPIIFPSAANGFHLGLHTKINNIRRQDPHKVEIMAQVLATDRARYKHFFQLDLPYAFGGDFRFTGRVSYNRDISHHYYGLGNDTTVTPSLLEGDNPYYKSIRSGPSFNGSLFYKLSRQWRLGPIFGLKWTDIEAPTGSLLAQEQALGINGGKTHYAGIAVVHDTLDFEPYPRRGSWKELYLAWYGPYLGDDYQFFRATFTYRQYIPLHPKLILGHRTLLESMSGTIPFYEMNAVGGSDGTIGFGGDRFLRGYDGNRYMDNLKTVFGAELRWDPLQFEFSGQDLALGFVPFIDIGRVWDRFFPFQLGTWHASTGWGTRIIWSKRLVIRGDWAITPEGTSFYIELGNSF